jgi:hypothetical protein
MARADLLAQRLAYPVCCVAAHRGYPERITAGALAVCRRGRGGAGRTVSVLRTSRIVKQLCASIGTTLTPPGTQCGATPCKSNTLQIRDNKTAYSDLRK